MLKHCRRCDRMVLPNDSGQCPGCLSAEYLEDPAPEILESLAAKPQGTETILRSHATLPMLCPFCGEAASASRVLTWRRQSPHASPEPGLAVAQLGWAGRLFSFLLTDRDQTISFRLPYCAACRDKQLHIARMEWDDYHLVAFCHPRFAEALAALPSP